MATTTEDLQKAAAVASAAEEENAAAGDAPMQTSHGVQKLGWRCRGCRLTMATKATLNSGQF
jgi:hypothetical protein